MREPSGDRLMVPSPGLPDDMLDRTFYILTFGCQMNDNDSNWLARALESRGFRRVSSDNADEAAVRILNTCSVRDKPEQKVYSEIGRIAHRCKVLGQEDVVVAVGGCVAQQVGDELFRRFPIVRLVFGTDGISRAPEAIERIVENPSLKMSCLDFSDDYVERPDAIDRAPAASFVNIMQGCDNFCAYCIVPFVRGRQRSREAGQILDECRKLIDKGAREITLLGQNVNSYGLDGAGHPGFAKLLRQVASLPGLLRLRFVTSHPKDIAPEVVRAFGELENLCPRLHLPLQSGSDKILKSMGRHYTVGQYRETIRELRKARPDIIFTTDMIVGFPGETEDDFLQSMDMMREVGFAASFSFVYSDRPGARAVDFPFKIPRETGLERLSRLQAWQIQASTSILNEMIGKHEVVLIEEPGQREDPAGEAWQGRTGHGHTVHVTLPPGARSNWAGKMLPVRIIGASKHSLKGRQEGEPW